MSDVADLHSDTPGVRVTRRELARRLGSAALAGAATHTARPTIGQVLLEIGYGGTGHGLVPWIARHLWRWW